MESLLQLDLDELAKGIHYEQVQEMAQVQLFDLRSPIEFSNSHIPGAINLPLFSDEERSIIGTLYKNNGEASARWKSMEIVSPKLPQLMQTLRIAQQSGKQPVIYCWRGGMRSKSVAFFAGLSGLTVARLEGGFRAYRQFIIAETPLLLPGHSFVLHGKTGVGKTELLHMLQSSGERVIDLEGAANHKGSIFGSYGTGEPHNQKTFDSILYHQLLAIKGAPYFLVEAESKRIGKVAIPDSILENRTTAVQIMIHRSMEDRTERTYSEYVLDLESAPWFREKTGEIVTKLARRIPTEQAKQLLASFATEDYRQIIRILFEFYYDPRYSHKESEYQGEFYHIYSDDNTKVLAEIKAIITARMAGQTATADLSQ